MGVALWYCPKKSSILHMELSNLMLSLQSLFPDAPDIHTPHITITSGLNVQDSKKILTTVVLALKSTRNKARERSSTVNSVASAGSLSSVSAAARDSTYSNSTSGGRARSGSGLKLPRSNASTTTTTPARDEESGLTFQRLSLGSTFFTRVKLDIAKENNKVLLSLVKLIRDMYVPKQQDNAKYVINEYQPHVSLVYSDRLPSRAEYLNIVNRIADAMDCEIDPTSGAIVDDAMHTSDSLFSNAWSMLNGTFMVVNCVGPIEEWEVLDSVDL
ncbi:hypothetical protein ACO0QE_001694 [Hanseniaspora vineae]